MGAWDVFWNKLHKFFISLKVVYLLHLTKNVFAVLQQKSQPLKSNIRRYLILDHTNHTNSHKFVHWLLYPTSLFWHPNYTIEKKILKNNFFRENTVVLFRRRSILFNPLIPKSDKVLISLYNLIPLNQMFKSWEKRKWSETNEALNGFTNSPC